MSDLVEVSFLPVGKVAWLRPGATLVEAGTAAGLDIVTGCTRGMCGTDPVRIVEGQGGLEPPGDDERATLDRMGLADSYRLACSARLRAGVVVVELDTF